jgi:CHAD domain-containing protein
VPLIESRPGTEFCPQGLLAVMLRQLGVAERSDVSALRVDLAPTVRADVGARQIHQALLGVLKVNEPGVRANLDTEFLHDFRVVLRRTRSMLGQIRHVFPLDVTEHFSGEFSWIGRLTGPLRDMDVLVLALREHRDVLAEEMEELTAFLGRAQQREHHALVEALDSKRYRRLLSDWEAFLERPARSDWEAHNAGHLLGEVVSQRAWRLSRRITSNAVSIGKHTASAGLHKVRIDGKKLRYLVDVTPTFCDAADFHRILDALKKLQRVLGDFNDALVQEKLLVECLGDRRRAGGECASGGKTG